MKNINENILAKYCENALTETELSQLNTWLAADEAHQRELEDYQKLWIYAAEKSDINPNINKAWAKVASKTVHKKTKGSWFKYAAAVLLISTFGGLLAYYQFFQTAQMLTFQTGKKSAVLQLADGSMVTLNSFSMLEYPEKFVGASREVKLIGEAFFDIEKNPEKPFIIAANGSAVRVLGTSFLVSARNQDVQVSVRTGKVEFKSPHQQKVVLLANQTAQYSSKNDSLSSQTLPNANVFAFQTKILAFNNTNLKDVIAEINQAYQSDVRLGAGSWETYNLSVRFENENLEQVLDIIAETFNIKLIPNKEGFVFEKK